MAIPVHTRGCMFSKGQWTAIAHSRSENAVVVEALNSSLNCETL